mmetsp:Transcript_11896/g.51223  ORF Transcript_11896/g.51223 Transcript_11896/m.51223 type:complete len:234 (+) Transcript_11896:2827-3528(+)
MSRSIFSLRLVSLSVAALADAASSRRICSSFSIRNLSASAALSCSVTSMTSSRSMTIWFTCSSRSAASSSRCRIMSLICSCCFAPPLPPCAAALERSATSFFSAWTFSLARVSFSLDASTIFHAFSTSPLSLSIVPWSSSASFSALWTFAALATISALRSRHFWTSRFSLSLELTSALKTFSYSSLNLAIAGSFSSSAMTLLKSSVSRSPIVGDARPEAVSLISGEESPSQTA